MNIIAGSQVWVEDHAAAWIDGLVTKIKGAEAEIELTDGRKVDGCQVLPFFSSFLMIFFSCLLMS